MTKKHPSVGIITLYYHNYNLGGMLQAYALQHAIESFGVRCEQISYDRLCELPKKKTVLGKMKAKGKNVYHFVCSIGEQWKKRKRTKNFRLFEEFIPHSKRIYGNFSMKEACEEYDAFVCGSDQIWNDWDACQEEVDCNTLCFVPNDRPKVAYAVSTGSLKFSHQFEEKLKKGLTRLSAISVREKSSIPLVERLSGQTVTTQLDPVLLLSREDWSSITDSKYAKQKTPYILCYFLAENEKVWKSAIELAHHTKKRIIFLPFSTGKLGRDIQYPYEEDFEAGPREFIALIQHADLILTDSFHATVFSVIFHKNYYVFPRNTKVGLSSMNSRVVDFLSMIGMENHLIEEMSQTMDEENNIDYRNIDEILRRKAQLSKEFLRKALNVHPSEEQHD